MALTALNLLSARKVETAQPKSKVYQLRDGGSLFLRIQPNGSKLWWYRYRLGGAGQVYRSEEHTSELQSLMRITYAVFCLKKKKINANLTHKVKDKHKNI